MKNNLLKTLKFLIGWPLSLIALFFLLKFFTPQLSQIQQYIASANILLLALALLAFQMYFLLRVFLWQKILQSRGHNIALKDTAWYWSIAEINRYIPGNIWSIIGRGALFGKLGIKQSTLLFAWLQESLLVLLGSLSVGALGLVMLFHHVLPNFPFKAAALYAAFFAILLVNLAWIFQKNIRRVPFLPKKLHTLSTEPLPALGLLLLAIGSFICFGIGTYFSISALFYLPLQHLWLFTGFFTLSFFAGYISLITPMGLGIRELIMSDGLLVFLSASVVGFTSLFARFFLIVAECIFLLLSFLFFTVKRGFSHTLVMHVKKHKFAYLLWLSIALYIAYFTTVSFLRYTNFFTGRFDLGNMDQTVWNTLHGKIFMLTDPNGTNSMSRLGTHADFILILLAPFYLFWEDPRMLLLIQTVVLALGALFVYGISQHVIKNKLVSFLLALCFLLNPSVQYTNLYDFHAVTLATTFFLGTWYFILRKQYVFVILFLILAGLTKEEAWIVVGFFGIYLFFFEKKRLLGSLLTTLPFAAFYVLVWKLIPLARGGQHFALSYYSDFGSTPTSVVKNVLFSPLKILGIIFNPHRLVYLLELFLPVGFLSLLAPQFLLFALPDLAINLLSSNTQLQQISFQYTAVITPFLFIATIYALRFLLKKYQRLTLSFLTLGILCTTTLSAFFFGPLPGAFHPDIDVFTRQETDRAIIEKFLNDIPSSFSVAATNNIGSHLSHRQNIYTIPVGMDKADVVVFLLNDQFAQPSLAAQKQMAEEMKHDKNYIEVFKENDFVVFERRNLYTRNEPVIEKGELYPAAIDALQHRDFEGGSITVQKVLKQNSSSTTFLFSYPSDGLTLYGRADVPNTGNALPVVIINRGFLTPSAFREEASYGNIAQAFAANGFIAITPNYRNNGESDRDSSIVGILGDPIDVLNLVASLPKFPKADIKHVFLWGYSIGGQITLSSLAAYDQNKNITPTICAASVWAPVIDPYSAYADFHALFPDVHVPYQSVYNVFGQFNRNPIPWESVSPLFYLDDITTPVRVSHGLSDTISPYEWSIELYSALKSYHNNAQISLYPNTNHNFTGTWRQAVAADIAYFQSFLQ